MSRIIQTDQENGLTIKIGSRSVNILAIGFMVFLLFGWGGAWLTTMTSLMTNAIDIQTPFVLIWLILWTLGGSLAIFLSIWHMYGYERIQIKNNELIIDYRLLGISFGKKFNDRVENCKNLRAIGYFDDHKDSSPWLYNVMGIGDGVITLDHLSKRFRFGRFLTEDEANKVVNTLNPYFEM